MYLVQLSDFQTMCQQRVDELNTVFVPLINVTRMVNLGIGTLYNRMVSVYEDYFLTVGPGLPTTSNVDTYAIPTDCYKLRGVELQLDSLHWVTVPSYEYIERNDYNYFPVSAYISPAGTSIRYRLQGQTVRFIPLPSVGGITYRFQYIPMFSTQLVNPTDTFDCVTPGWEEYVVLYVAGRMLQINESDTTAVDNMLAKIEQQIDTWATDRDAGAQKKMTSNRNRNRWRGGWPGLT
jgi:hypothetical protein